LKPTWQGRGPGNASQARARASVARAEKRGRSEPPGNGRVAYGECFLALLACLLLASPVWADAVNVTDDLGRIVRLEAPARRIVCLYGAFSEILADMGLADRLVARTKADTRPASILALPSVGTHMRPNLELVVGLHPDLVVQLAGRRQATPVEDRLRELGIPVAVFAPATMEALFSVMARLGVLTGAPGEARDLEAAMRRRLDAVSGRVQGAPRPSVCFEVRWPDLLAAGQASIVNDVIRLAGGRNCLNVEKKMVHLSEEALLGLDPDVYVVQRGPMNRDPLPLARRPRLSTLRAARAGRVLEVDEQVFSRPGPRVVQAVETLAAFLHPRAEGGEGGQ